MGASISKEADAAVDESIARRGAAPLRSVMSQIHAARIAQISEALS